MNGWLGPISIRLVNVGPSFGGLRSQAQDIRQPEAFLGQARLRSSFDLGRPVHQYLGQEPKCCNAPDGTTKCFDHTDGVCQNTWNSAAPTKGAPSCIKDSRGEWVHPDCWNSPPPPAAKLAGGVRRLPFVVVNFGPMPGRRNMMGQAEAQKLIACINGPDLYDIYNPDMSLVAKGILDPNGSYPNAQIDFAKVPPCPVPQATGVGGLCDIPIEYLAPKDPSAPPGKAVLVCYDERGVTLFDYVTGAVIGTHLSGACLSLLSNVTVAQEGDSRCVRGSSSSTPPPSSGDDQGTPPSDPVDTGVYSAASGGEEVTGSEPIPATGVSVLPSRQETTTSSPPTGAFPGQPFAAAPMANKPVPIAKAPAPLPPACPLGPVPLRQWAEGCMGK